MAMPEAPPRSALSRCAPSVLLLIAMAACAQVQIGERYDRPYWRHPGPAVTEPQPRIPVPDDGFHDHLAEGGGPGRPV